MYSTKKIEDEKSEQLRENANLYQTGKGVKSEKDNYNSPVAISFIALIIIFFAGSLCIIKFHDILGENIRVFVIGFILLWLIAFFIFIFFYIRSQLIKNKMQKDSKNERLGQFCENNEEINLHKYIKTQNEKDVSLVRISFALVIIPFIGGLLTVALEKSLGENIFKLILGFGGLRFISLTVFIISGIGSLFKKK